MALFKLMWIGEEGKVWGLCQEELCKKDRAGRHETGSSSRPERSLAGNQQATLTELVV